MYETSLINNKEVTNTTMKIGQIMSWMYKRYIKYIVTGVLLGCVVANVTLHLGAELRYICEESE